MLDQFSASHRAGNQFVDWIGMLAAHSDQLFSAMHANDVVAAEGDMVLEGR